jgi:hypothetical protein
MPTPPDRGKLYPLFTLAGHDHEAGLRVCRRSGGITMAGLAIAMFIALFGWGSRYFGWEDPDGKVQLALATCFILGIISGYRARS